MNRFYKKTITVFTVLILFAINLYAQQYHFIYLQADNKQPFYIKMDKKILTSSASGYLIISKLVDGEYIFTIGFPNNEWPEQNVKCSVNNKNEGYLLKYFGEKTWGLFNIQTMSVVKAVVPDNDATTIQTFDKKNNNTSPANTILKDTLTVVARSAVESEEASKTTVRLSMPYQIVKLLSTNNLDGAEMIYIDNYNNKSDTIRIFIPADKKNVVKQIENLPTNNNVPSENIAENKPAKLVDTVKEVVTNNKTNLSTPPSSSTINDDKKNNTTTTSPKFIEDISNTKTQPNILPPVEEANAKPIPKVEVAKPAIPNSDCKNIATDDDFIKLRKKMVAENTDDDMIDIAKKIFKTKCFTTDQIKNLGVLFLNDKGRYNFFDVAYPYVTDSNNFSLLESQLTDTYFINRFKAMLRH